MSENEPVENEPVEDLPRWFTIPLATAVVFVATAGFGGVALLAAGFYHPVTITAIAGLAAGLVAVGLVRRVERPRRTAHGAAIAVVALAIGFFAFNAVFHSEHLLTDRDPGIYVNTGRSIARHNELHPVIRSGAFADREMFSFAAPSMGDNKNGRLIMGFFPMLPVLLALGSAAGGDLGLLLVGVVLGTLALLCAYALGARAVGPRWALFVPVFLAINPLPGWFARDAYSELVVEMVVLGGVWLYLLVRSARAPVLAGVAGAVVASGCLARIDAVGIVAGLVVLAGIEWLRGRERGAVPDRRAVAAFAGAMLAVTYAADWLANETVHGYVAVLGDQYNSLLRVLYAAIVAMIVIALIDWRVPSIRARLRRVRRLCALALMAAVVGVATWAYFWRPKSLSALPALAEGESMTRALRRSINAWHRTQTLHWLADWFGPLTLAVALAGLLVLVWRAFHGDAVATAILLLVVPLTVMFLVRPSIKPDQPWAMRRFLPVTIPGIALMLAVVVRVLYDRARAIRASAQRAVALVGVAVVGVAIVVPSANAAAPLLQARNQKGAAGAVHELCSAAGADGAIVIHGYRYINLEFPQTLRGFCGIPVARPKGGRVADLPGLAQAWQGFGRKLFVLTAVPGNIRSMPGVRVIDRAHIVVEDRYAPKRTVGDRSREFVPRPREAWLLEIQPLPVEAVPSD